MRVHSMLFVLAISGFVTGCATPPRSSSVQALQTHTERTVEAGCATCIFHMKGVTGCVLAVKVDGKPYLVSGSSIDDHGDAHASDGLCNSSRRAVVEGTIVADRFVVERIELLAQDPQ